MFPENPGLGCGEADVGDKVFLPIGYAIVEFRHHPGVDGQKELMINILTSEPAAVLAFFLVNQREGDLGKPSKTKENHGKL
jgi:hypothetical protein